MDLNLSYENVFLRNFTSENLKRISKGAVLYGVSYHISNKIPAKGLANLAPKSETCLKDKIEGEGTGGTLTLRTL
jgi:hypothetical protein